MRKRLPAMLVLSAGAALSAGCGDDLSLRRNDVVKPTIAVMKFENRARFPLKWDLGDGMADILVARLVKTGRFRVVERPEIDAVMRELEFQHSGATREHRRAALGRLKNVEYLIKGTITDFGHVGTKRGFFGTETWNVLGGTQRAVMGMVLYIVDVESGEIAASETIEESVKAGDTQVQAAYKNVAFGGSVFHRTPLGRVTAKAIDRAIRKISHVVAVRPWQPRVAQLSPAGEVILNGGRNRDVEVGTEYEVFELGKPIVDPETGDIIGESRGRCVGRVRVVAVQEGHSTARPVGPVAGVLRIGQVCRKAGPTSEPSPGGG